MTKDTLTTGSPVLVCAGTTNPSKLEGIGRAFRRAFSGGVVELVSVKLAGMNPQPMGLVETLHGALERAIQASHLSDCDFYVGVEAGIIELLPEKYVDLQVAVVLGPNKDLSIGFSPAFQVPPQLVRLVTEGRARELEEAVEITYGVADIGEREGLIHLLSKGLIDRPYLTEEAVLMALLPWVNEDAYRK